MAFSYTKLHTMPVGNKKMVMGTYTGTTGSDDTIETGFTYIYTGGITDSAGEAATKEQLSFSGGTVTFNYLGDRAGTWWFIGH
jgi:hypothetical protein